MPDNVVRWLMRNAALEKNLLQPLFGLNTYAEVGIVSTNATAAVGLFKGLCKPLVVLSEKKARIQFTADIASKLSPCAKHDLVLL